MTQTLENAPLSDMVSLRAEGEVAVVTLDDGKVNAISHSLLRDTQAALDDAGDAKALVLAGREGVFTGGFDLEVIRQGPAAAAGLMRAGMDLMLRLYRSDVPVVLACTGHSVAMGGVLLMAADLRIGATGPFKVGLNEVAIGIPLPAPVVELAAERINPSARLRAVLLAQLLSPDEATAAGFLDAAVPPDEVVATAVSHAAALAESLDPRAFQATRAAMRGTRAEEWARALDRDVARRS